MRDRERVCTIWLGRDRKDGSDKGRQFGNLGLWPEPNGTGQEPILIEQDFSKTAADANT